jgi:hypothetical protein
LCWTEDNEPEVMAVMKETECAVLPAFELFFCHFAMRAWWFLDVPF